MEASFTAKFFAGNREKLRSLFTGTAPIVITANGVLQKSRDTTFQFRQDSNFWYLTGIDEPDLILVLDKDKEYLILPERSELQNIFDGSITSTEISKTTGIKTVLSSKDGWRLLNNRLSKVKHVATLAAPPQYMAKQGFYPNPARSRLIRQIKLAARSTELLDLGQHFGKMRSIKQPQELVAMRSAVDITVGAFRTLKPAKIAKKRHEFQVEAQITEYFRSKGVNHAYEPIVASGINACTLHYTTNNQVLNDKELLLIDAGSEVSHYSSDITRTMALRPPSRRQRTVYETVQEVQQFALELIKPGVVIKEYELKVEQFMGEKLRALGLIKSIDHANVRHYYPHASSHYLGLDAHDVGDYTVPLEPNMVLTVEPGIYIPEEKIGIRLEDDVLVTKAGNKVLSHKLPLRLW